MFEGLRPECPANSQNAYVTLATNADYALGALALVNSIKATGTGADCVVLHTAVPEDGLARLCDAGARLIAVDLLTHPRNSTAPMPATRCMRGRPLPKG